jgi:hypothetical protein
MRIPFFFDAAILSRMRSPVTSRSNWANDSSTLRVRRAMLVVATVQSCAGSSPRQPTRLRTGSIRSTGHHRQYWDGADQGGRALGRLSCSQALPLRRHPGKPGRADFRRAFSAPRDFASRDASAIVSRSSARRMYAVWYASSTALGKTAGLVLRRLRGRRLTKAARSIRHRPLNAFDLCCARRPCFLSELACCSDLSLQMSIVLPDMLPGPTRPSSRSLPRWPASGRHWPSKQSGRSKKGPSY